MSATGFALFETAIGVCGIAWSDQGVVAVQLPDGDAAGTRARLLRRHPGAVEGSPPDEVQQAIADMQAHLAGQRRDLGTVRLDPEGIPPFNHRVYEVARTIPPGATTTYGALATRLGEPGAARAVGQALGHNPYPLIVPCHRVLAAGGHLGGFSAAGGRVTKLRLLELEGFRTDDHPSLFDEPPAGDG